MVKPDLIKADDMGSVLGLLVHDFRNPAATITANADFLEEVGLVDTDAIEALQDVKLAVRELRRGLDMLAWISRWFTGHVPLEAANGDAGVFLERLERADTPVPVTVEIAQGDQLYAQGAQVAVDVVDLLGLEKLLRVVQVELLADEDVKEIGVDVVIFFHAAEDGQRLGDRHRLLVGTDRKSVV